MQKDITVENTANKKKKILPVLILVAVLIAWGFDNSDGVLKD